MKDRTHTEPRVAFLSTTLIGTLLAIVVLVAGEVGASEPPWADDLDQAIERAQAERKLMLVEFSSRSCGWCRRLEQNTHTDERVQTTLANGFVPVRVFGGPRDMRQRHHVSGTPHTLVFAVDDADEPAMLLRIRGYQPPARYLESLAESMRRFQQRRRGGEAAEAMALLVDAERHVQLRRVDLDAALAGIERSIAVSDELAAAHDAHGRVLMRRGEPAAAIEAFSRAIDLEPKAGWPYHYRGTSRYDLGQWREAGRDFVAAMHRLDGEGHYAVLRAWLVALRLGERAEADRLVHDFLDRPRETGDGFQRGMLRYVVDRISADTLIEQAGGTDWRRLQAHFTIGSRALGEGDREKAVHHLGRAARLEQTQFADHWSALADLELLGEAP